MALRVPVCCTLKYDFVDFVRAWSCACCVVKEDMGFDLSRACGSGAVMQVCCATGSMQDQHAGPRGTICSKSSGSACV